MPTSPPVRPAGEPSPAAVANHIRPLMQAATDPVEARRLWHALADAVIAGLAAMPGRHPRLAGMVRFGEDPEPESYTDPWEAAW